ncbi:MAG: hypothetical protein Q7Q73_02465 [Verrucomicrobiota bacterium JB024]|nr:hypothetical protein [Verrucomicrobiota bacterium JB024]
MSMNEPANLDEVFKPYDSPHVPEPVYMRTGRALWMADRYGLDPEWAVANEQNLQSAFGITDDEWEGIRAIGPYRRNILGKSPLEPKRVGGSVAGDITQEMALGASDAAWASAEGAFGLLEESAKVTKTRQIGEELKQLGKSPTSNILFLEKQLRREDLTPEKRSEYQSRLDQAQNDPDRQRIYRELSAINPTKFVATVAGTIRKASSEFRAYNDQYYTDRINPEFADSYGGKIARGFGQMGFYIPAGMTGVGGMAAIASGSYQEAVDDYFQSQGIDKSTATDEQRAEAARVGFTYALPASLLERAGLGPILKRVFAGADKLPINQAIKKLSVAWAEGFASEGSTEAAQQALQNTIARLSEYDPGREITEGALESFIVGGFVGATGAGGVESLNGLKSLVDYRASIEKNPRRTPIRIEDIPTPDADTVIPEKDGLADRIPQKLKPWEFRKVAEALTDEEIQADNDPELIRRAFVEGDPREQEEYNRLRRPTYAEAQAAQEAAKTDEQKQREQDEAVLQIDGEPDAFAIQMKHAMNLTDQQAVAVSIVVDATGLGKDSIDVRRAADGQAYEGRADALAQAMQAGDESRSFDAARELVRPILKTPIKNTETGLEAKVTSKTLKKMTSRSAVEKSVSPQAQAAAVANVQELFEQSHLFITHPDMKGESGVKQIHRFFAPMPYKGEVLSVKLTVKEMARSEQGNIIYTLEAVDVTRPASESRESGEAGSMPPRSTIADKELAGSDVPESAYAGLAEKVIQMVEKVKRNQYPQNAKGMVEFTADGKAIITGFASADVSTGIHEVGHVARKRLINREVSQDKRLGITDEDIRVAEEWAGAKDGNWTREAEEKFARGFERYLRDGKSPNAQLAKVFEALSQWLKQIYDKLKGSPVAVRITPEMRQVFDNLVTRSQRLRVEGRTEEASSMDALEKMAREATETLDTLYQLDETLKDMDSGEQGKSNKSKAQIDAETSLLLDEAFKVVGKGGLLTAAQRAKLKERSSQLNRSDERVARLRAALTEQRNRLEARMEKRRIEQVERLKSDFAKERIGVTDAIARMEALRKYFPPEVFGKISGFKNLTKIKGHEAQSRFVDQFATRLVEENEKHFKRILRERIEKRVKRIKSDIKAARAGRKKLPNQDAIISYLKRISLDTSTARKQTENESLALLARLQDDNYEMSPEDMEIMGRASMISIGDPRTSLDTLRMVEADIERIQADGRTELEQRKATEKERFEAQAAEISESIKRNLDKSGKPAFIENEIKRQGSRLKRMFWDTIRAETIAAWATGSRDSKLLNEVILPIGNANFKKKDRIHAFSKKLLRWYESENIPVSNISDTGNPVIQLGGNGTAVYGMTLDEAMWVYANSMNPYNREHLRNTVLSGGIHLSDTVIDGISNALPDNAKRVVHAYMEYTGTEQYDRLNTWFKDRHGVNMIKEESYFPIENLSRDGSAGDFFNDTTKRMLFNNGATKGRINSSLSFKGFDGRAGSFMNTVLRGTTNVEHMLNVQDVAFDTLRTLRDKNVRGQIERISPDAYATLLDWLKRSASGRATLNESKIGAFLSGTLRRNASTAFVALNPASWLKVGASAPLALTEVKPGYILRSASNYAFNIKEVTGFVMENSDYMRHRPENLRLELSEMYEKAKAAYSGLGRNMSRWAKLQAKSFMVFEAFDMTQSTIIWKAKYDEVLNETGSHEEAVKKADMVVRTTQQTGRIEDLPALFAGGTIERLITQFTVDLNALGNLAISKSVAGELDGISRKVAFASAGWVLPVLILAMADATKDWLWEFLGWREPKDWDERKEQFGYDVVKYGVGQLTGYVPVFGRVIEAQAARAVGNSQEAYWLSSQSLPALAGIEQMARADSAREVVKGVNIITGNPATNYIDEIWKQVEDE